MTSFSYYLPDGWRQMLEYPLASGRDLTSRARVLASVLEAEDVLLEPNLLQLSFAEFHEPGQVPIPVPEAIEWEIVYSGPGDHYLAPGNQNRRREVASLTGQELLAATMSISANIAASTGREYLVDQASVENARYKIDTRDSNINLAYERGQLNFPVHSADNLTFITVPPVDYVLPPPVSLYFAQEYERATLVVVVNWSRWLEPGSTEFNFLRKFLCNLVESGWVAPWGVDQILR